MKSMGGEGKRRSLERLVEKENTSKIFNASDDNILFVPTHYTTVVPLAAVQTHRSPLDTYFAKIFFCPRKGQGFRHFTKVFNSDDEGYNNYLE